METKIKAKEEEEKKPRKKSFLSRYYSRFNYPLKKMDILMGKYHIDHYVILKQKALIKSLIYFSIAARETCGAEMMAVLVGKKDKEKIYIEDAWVADCMSSSVSTEIDVLELIKMNKKAKEKGMEICGWSHSHPGFGSHPSYIDTATNQAWEKFIKDPIMLVCSFDDFFICTTEKGHIKKVDFIIPPSNDTHMDLDMGYINYKKIFSGNIAGLPPGLRPDGDEFDIFPDGLCMPFLELVGMNILVLLGFFNPWAWCKHAKQ